MFKIAYCVACSGVTNPELCIPSLRRIIILFLSKIDETMSTPKDNPSPNAVAPVPGCELTESCYLPYEEKLSVGELVLWNNIDSAAHTVSSGNPAEGKSNYFDSGIITPGDTFLHKFDSAGSYSYYCELHPWMIGLISVGDSAIPSWIKNNAGWWADGTIDDQSFLTGIEWLVSNGIINIKNS